MDEAIKIYEPRGWKKVENPKPKAKSTPITPAHPISKWKSRAETMREVVEEHEQKIALLNFRYPWFNVVFNYVIVIAAVLLFVAFCAWGVQIRINRQAETLMATAMAEYQATQDAAEKERLAAIVAEQQSFEAMVRREATEAAKAIYGIRNFIDKYGYSEKDLKTYVRCMCDRMDFGVGASSLEEVIAQPAQFLGYSEQNPVIDEYYKVAKEEIETWHTETSRPWDSSYRFAELKEDGIWLSSEFNANGYARRMRY